MPSRERERAGADADLVANLRRPETWGAPRSAVILRQTHSAWVFLVGDRAFKVKKPIVLPYLNFATPERRRAVCEREVELNRRLAPDLYLGVRRLVRHRGTVRVDGRGGVVDFAVEMRRFDDGETLAARVVGDAVDADEAAAIGGWLAGIHGACPVTTGSGMPGLRHRVEDCFATLSLLGHQVNGLERFVSSFLEARRAELDLRAAAGLVRDIHGDLRSEHILCRDGRLQAIDCIEYSDELRMVDVAVDVGSLVMDLLRLHRPDLAAAVVEGYRAVGGDPGDDGLVDFHATCAALMRAKFALVRAAQQEEEEELGNGAAAEGERLVALAQRLAWRARMPAIIAVTGEDELLRARVAEAVGAATGLARLGLAGVRQHLGEIAGRFTVMLAGEPPSAVAYGEILRLAAGEVALRGGAIVEAPFDEPEAQARLIEVAIAVGARLVVAECGPEGPGFDGPEARVVPADATPADIVDLVAGALDRGIAATDP